MTKEFVDKNKDAVNDGLLERIIPTFENGLRNKRKSAWTGEELEKEIMGYFGYSNENNLKPCKAGLRLWLGVSKSQYHAWYTEPSKYGDISELITMANDFMEIQYINRSEQYPTSNIFLLKTSCGYVETSKVDITSGSGQATADEIGDAINKLGLNTPKEP